MVKVAFFLRFKSQLQRIRPELVPRLEGLAVHAIKEAGGKVTGDHSLICAVFDENALGFWLDILQFIETLTQTLDKASIDLQGYTILAGKDIPETPNGLCRFLAGGKGGVFLDTAVSAAMRPYITVEEQGRWAATANQYGMGPLSRLSEIKIFVPAGRLEFPALKQNGDLPDSGQQPGILVASRSFEGKRDKLYVRAAGFANSGESEEFPPLFVRFGSGGLNALIDSWAEWIHPASSEEDMHTAWEFLFRERLRGMPSAFAVRTAGRFFPLLVKRYRGLAQAKGKIPVIILENIQNGEEDASNIVIKSLRGYNDFLLLGTCTGEITDDAMVKWRPLFPQITRINTGEVYQKLPEIPLDLWEIGYACLLFGRYFPPDLIPQLFEESGKSASTISRALLLLYALRVTDTPLDPRPWHKDFQSQAEAILGARKERIQAMVRGRLLAWVAQRKINPCMRLLEILAELGGVQDITDNLIVQSIQGEVSGADDSALEALGQSGIPPIIADPVRAPILHFLLDTLIALHGGNARKIHAAFANQPPDCSAFPLLRAQMLLNQSLYYLGMRNNDSTVSAVKESSLICQKKNGVGLSQAYLLFALANLLRRRMSETIDYLGFSLEHAAKSGGFQDIGMAAYYAATVQLLYGNLSRSKILAEKAHRHFLRAGSPEWADRSRFLLGRLAFEIGSYRQAIDIFEDIRQKPEGDCSPEKNALLAAWIRRATLCLAPSADGASASDDTPSVDGGRDSDLFEIETRCLSGDYARAAELCTMFAARPADDDFLGIERPDWHSGFAQCELLYFSWNDLRDRMLCAYHALAGNEEAKHTLQRVLRSGDFLEIDPSDVFYHYAWYRVLLEQSEPNQVDINTAVSVAFKRLQSRAIKIDDMETRRQYLTQPRWNKALSQAAGDLKLV